LNRIETRTQEHKNKTYLEIEMEWKWNWKMKERKAYVVKAWEEDHATWNGEFAPR